MTERLIDSQCLEMVIVAIGSQLASPMIKGLFRSSIDVVAATDVLDRQVTTGDRGVVLGGGQMKLAVADYLAEDGKSVTVIIRKGYFIEEMSCN